jgi:hypothetical protein
MFTASKIAAASNSTLTVTEDTWTTIFGTWEHWGMEVITHGSMSPTDYRGLPVTTCKYYDAVGLKFFRFRVTGIVTQDFFTSIQPQDGLKLLTAAAEVTFTAEGGVTRWHWASVIIPARWDGTGTSIVTIV